MTNQPPDPADDIRLQVLAEVKSTREALVDIPRKLELLENKTDRAVWGVVGVAFALLLAAVGFLWHDSHQNGKQNDRFDDFAYCQAQYNQANATISKIRTDLASKYNANTARNATNSRNLNLTVGKIVAKGKGDINKAFSDYNAEDAAIQKELAKIEAARADNPLPEYPNCYDKYIKQTVPAAPIPK